MPDQRAVEVVAKLTLSGNQQQNLNAEDAEDFAKVRRGKSPLRSSAKPSASYAFQKPYSRRRNVDSLLSEIDLPLPNKFPGRLV